MQSRGKRDIITRIPAVFHLSMKPASVKYYAAVLCSVPQSCPTLCDPNDCSPPGSSVHGILQARMLEWVAMTPTTVAHQAPLSMEFSRQEYWSGLPCPTPGDLPILGSNPHLLHLLHWQVDCLPLHLGSPVKYYKCP